MKTTKKRATVPILPVFDARTLRAVVMLCVQLQFLTPKVTHARGYNRALNDVADRCLAHLPYAKGATPDERRRPTGDSA